MKRRHTCKTCFYFRPGASADTSVPVTEESDTEVGACEYLSPSAISSATGLMISAGCQPAVHATRSCSEHASASEVDDRGLRLRGLGKTH